MGTYQFWKKWLTDKEIKIDLSLELVNQLLGLDITVNEAIDLLERFGNQLGLPHSKKVAQTLFELRISGKQEIRIFYTFHDKEIVLLHGFVKKSSRIPKRELENAKHRLAALDAK